MTSTAQSQSSKALCRAGGGLGKRGTRYTKVCTAIHTFVYFGRFVSKAVFQKHTFSDAMPRKTLAGLWDRVGITLSGICVVHCLLLPVLLALLPLWPFGETLHAWMHPAIAVLLVPTTALAMISAYRRHRRWMILVLLGSGLVFILAAGILGHIGPGAPLEMIVTMIGSFLLITGHWINWRRGAHCSLPAGAPTSEETHFHTVDPGKMYASPELHARQHNCTAA